MIGQEIIAQCPMCSLAAGSNLEDGGTAGKGLNVGIMFMLSMPYLIISGFVYFLVKKYKKSKIDCNYSGA